MKQVRFWLGRGVVVSSFVCAISSAVWGQPAPVAANVLSSIFGTQSVMPAVAGASKAQLPSGDWLELGGVGANGQVLASAQIVSSTGGVTPVPATLNVPRAYATASMLPDGTVLILGGVDSSGLPISAAERFHPDTQRFDNLGDLGLIPRSRHIATLLANGQMLIAGGLDAHNQTLSQAELLDTASLAVQSISPRLQTARADAQAALLPSGDVLLQGGVDANGQPLANGELFETQTDAFVAPGTEPAALPGQSYSATPPAVQSTLPASNATQVAVSSRIAILFDKPLAPQTINAQTVTLIGPAGPVKGTVTPAEDGVLAFFVPAQQLLPAARYTLFVQGATDSTRTPVAFAAVSFTTASLGGTAGSGGTGSAVVTSLAMSAPTGVAAAASAAIATAAASAPVAASQAATDDEGWTPGAKNYHGNWTTGNPNVALRTLPRLPEVFAALYGAYPALKAKAPSGGPSVPAGTTAVAGQVLKLNGRPLAGASLTLGNRTVQTDANGEFLLADVSAGQQDLVIDGSTANHGMRQYGRFEYGMAVVQGKVNALPFVIWMTPLDTAHTLTIPSPTTAETDVRNPAIPGLELKIPAGTVIRDDKGNIVTKLTMTAIPVDQPPFPLPPLPVPVYFTIQPGGAHLDGISAASAQGAQLIYPNFNHEQPGASVDFWNYDPTGKGWYVYGQGTVSQDGTQIIPNPGIVIYEFTGAMVGGEPLAPSNAPPPCGGCDAGDPVDAYTGLFTLKRTDLKVNDVIPLKVQRTYRTQDNVPRSFGIGTTLSYDVFLVRDVATGWTNMSLILPNGSQVNYTPGPSGSGPLVAQTTADSQFYGSTLAGYVDGSCPSNVNAYWCITLKDGTVYGFPESDGTTNPRGGAMIAMRDRHGNVVQFQRDQYANLTQVTSPNGRHLNFTYDGLDRLTSASDDLGRTVTYQYDVYSRLVKVIDPLGNAETYTYGPDNSMLTGTDGNGNLIFRNSYDGQGRVQTQTYADQSALSFAYTSGANGNATETNITDGLGVVHQVNFNASGFMTGETLASGRPEQQTFTYVRDATTNRLLSETDALGRTTAYQYDSMANLTTLTQMANTASQATWSYTYDPTFNQLTSSTDPLSHVTTFNRDGQDNLTSVVDANGNTVSLTYDGEGRPLTSTANTGTQVLTTSYAYAGADLVSVSDPLGRTIRFTTDAIGRVIQVTDPLGNASQVTYDGGSRVLTTTDPAGHMIQRGYDAAGNLTAYTDANGNRTQFGYDARERQISKTDALNATETYGYDVNGNLVCVTDRKGQSMVKSLDGLGRPTRIGFGGTGCVSASFLSTESNTWDGGDRLTQAVDSSAGTITRSYDNFDRLTQETTPQGQVNYGYLANGLRQTMSVSGQSPINYTFDAGNRLTQINQNGAIVGFQYDSANRRTQLTLPNGVQVQYSYDNASELTELNYLNAQASLGTLSYGYDALGRTISIGGTLANLNLPPNVTPSTADADNRLASWSGSSLTYDANGNLVGQGSTSYLWDERNRLTAIEQNGSQVASFQYDAFDRRVTKTLNGTNTNLLYDGQQVVQEQNAGTPSANLLTGLRLDEYFQRTEGEAASTYLQDALGSTVALTNAAGTIQTS
jgi:YD repeat-containing protein